MTLAPDNPLLAEPFDDHPDLAGIADLLEAAAAKLEPPPPGPKRARWLATARPNQLPPYAEKTSAGRDWFVWLLLAGRGFGKTRSVAEHTAQFARDNAGAQCAIIGRTDAEARRVMLNGPSGLKSVLEKDEIRRISEIVGNTQVHLVNGSVIYVVGASSPDALRGLNLDMAACDELASWKQQNVLWDEVLMPAVRRGVRPHIVVSTTPKPTALIRRLVADDTTYVTKGSTFDNEAHLAPAFIEQMRRKYDGTRAGRQELYAEILSDVPGALLNRNQLDAGRVEAVPPPGLREVVIGMDPSDGTEESDEQAFTVAGLGWDHELYVTESWGGRESPVAYVRRVLTLAHELGATVIVEKNHGGRYLTATIDQVQRDLGYVVPYRTVNASQSKRTRAEPVGALFEQGKAHLVGVHADLEDQFCTWIGDGSPDRLDATVWALTHFLRHTLKPEETGMDELPEGVYAYGTGPKKPGANKVRREDLTEPWGHNTDPDLPEHGPRVRADGSIDADELEAYLEARDDDGVFGWSA